MPVKHTIALAIETGLLKKTRGIAARRGMSVSALLANKLEGLVAEDEAFSTR
jgi:hypothetical protein